MIFCLDLIEYKMALKTCLMNSTRKQYVNIGADYPSKIGEYLLRLEFYNKWDLRRDDIYISYTMTTFDYKLV